MTFILLTAIGISVSFAYTAGLIASLIVPAIIIRQRSRFRAGSAAAAYYAAALWAIVPIARSVLAPDLPGAVPILLWITATLLLTLPWALCWSDRAFRTRVLIALVVSIVPPLGVIGLASPVLPPDIYSREPPGLCSGRQLGQSRAHRSRALPALPARTAAGCSCVSAS